MVQSRCFPADFYPARNDFGRINGSTKEKNLEKTFFLPKILSFEGIATESESKSESEKKSVRNNLCLVGKIEA